LIQVSKNTFEEHTVNHKTLLISISHTVKSAG